MQQSRRRESRKNIRKTPFWIPTITGITAWCFLLLILVNTSFAQDATDDTLKAGPPPVQMEEVVVEGTMIQDAVRNLPKNVSVITEIDIQQSTGEKVSDMLSRQADVSIRSYSGQDKQATVDIRGMGATSGSNVIIVVDGIKMNGPDLTGSDFSSISLNQLEKIEIIRGAGSVVYGDGAVGGVINMITKKGAPSPTLELHSRVGSYQTTDTSVIYYGGFDELDFNLYTTHYKTDGYRDNGFFRKSEAGVKLGYEFFNRITLFLTTALHADEYGLPGPVNKQVFEDKDLRTSTTRPEDTGQTVDRRLIGGIKFKLSDQSHISVSRGYRFRDIDFLLGYSPLLSKSDQTGFIKEVSKSLSLTYNLKYGESGNGHIFKSGLDHAYSYYIRSSKTQLKRQNSLVEDFGAFVMNQWSLLKNLKMDLGYRQNSYQGKYRHDLYGTLGGKKAWINGSQLTRNWQNSATDLGFTYSLNSNVNLFSSLASSFRSPNVDELALAEDSLSPQSGQHLEFGAHYRADSGTNMDIALFQTRISDEIYFGENPSTGESVNRNYDDMTRRTGLEFEIKWFPLEELYSWFNIAYINAIFENRNTRIPLTSAFEVNAGMEYMINDQLSLSATGTAVGDRIDGNDENNDTYDKLKPYQLIDSKLTYAWQEGRRVYFGINNILDTYYSTIAYSETYYPMPTRNYYAGVDWTF
jgi:iron complex outermembrane recepter protein